MPSFSASADGDGIERPNLAGLGAPREVMGSQDSIKPASTRQSASSLRKNISFFKDNLSAYSHQVGTLDTYENIRKSTDQVLAGIDRLLDVGNGGTFDYDVNLVRELVAVDLFLEDLSQSAFPSHVQLKAGSALDLPEPDGSFDGVLMCMLIHHLVGKTFAQSRANVSRAIGEAFRVLKPGGKLVIVESCVPRWFYSFERFVFPAASRFIGAFMDHPATLQYTPLHISDVLREYASEVEVTAIPAGRWLLQYGFKFPSALTPARPYRFVARRRQ